MIEILPLGEIPKRLLIDLVRGLSAVYGLSAKDFSLSTQMDLPAHTLDARRGQYRSDVILDSIRIRGNARDKILAVTDVDLFVPQLNFVFGQAQFSGAIALISIRRLDPTFYGSRPSYETLLERTVKEAVHELGHTFGLSHCPNPACVMSFSNSILDVDKKSKDFCDKCRKKLQ
jgi:archaemetzincin